MTARFRVGITGYAHEVNALADVVGRDHGVEVSRTPGGLGATWAAGPLVRRLGELGDVEVVELPVWEFGASGPLDHADFRCILDVASAALGNAGRLDGVVVLGHGAGSTTVDRDADGTFLRMVRACIGSAATLVTVLDFHANLSAAMIAASDVIIGYRTNPHVDIHDRLVEAADQMGRLLHGEATVLAWCTLPMVLPQIAQLTAPEEPLGRVVARAQERSVEPIRNVSVFGGFSLGDTEDTGVSVCVTAAVGHGAEAAAVVVEVSELIWSLRDEYRLAATPLAVAVTEAGRAARGERSPVLLADVADNPGGGAPATSTFVLRALSDAGVSGVVMGLQCDPSVVDAAFAAGVGARLDVCFNLGGERRLAQPLAAEAEVLALTDGPFVPSRGVYAGSTRHPGRCCALDIGGIRVGVSSRPVQCADADTLGHVGLDPASARVVVVKSRGHFRAGFDHLFGPDQIIEVGAPGVATVALETVEWRHLRRPVFPLDQIEHWEPEVMVGGGRA